MHAALRALAAASLLRLATAHTFFLSRSRRSKSAATQTPMVQRKDTDVHAQIGGNETVLVKWCSAHYYTFYISVVPAKYQSHLYGSEDSNLAPLREYANILQVNRIVLLQTSCS